MNLRTELKNNWKSGISVALVSIPLSLSLAIASGASPMMGIITAVWAGLVAGIVGGSRFNIVGPAGALAGILIAYSLAYSPAILPILAVVSGIITLIIWIAKWDNYLIFVPSSVIHGFTLGVALTIASGQINSALGIIGLPTHETILSNTYESLQNIALLNWAAFIPFLVALGIMFALLKYRPTWPNSIVVAILGILFGYASVKGFIPFSFPTVGSKYPDISNNLFLFPDLSMLLTQGKFALLSPIEQLMAIFKSSLVISFVVVLETLISAKIADGMSKTKFRQSREVLGVGLANLASGIAGGLPASGVFARTALNVKSGATSNYSQIINAVAVALISIIFIGGFSYLPLSTTAAILVYISIRMVTAEHFKKLYKFDKSIFGLSMVVAILTFAVDATTGILIGTLASLLLFAHRLSVTRLDSGSDSKNFNPEEEKENAVIYRFAGALTYFNSKSHIERMKIVSANKPLILNFRNLNYIDVDGYEALDEIFEMLERRKQDMYIVRVRPEMLPHFAHHGWFKKLSDDQKVLLSTDAALAAL